MSESVTAPTPSIGDITADFREHFAATAAKIGRTITSFAQTESRMNTAFARGGDGAESPDTGNEHRVYGVNGSDSSEDVPDLERLTENAEDNDQDSNG